MLNELPPRQADNKMTKGKFTSLRCCGVMSILFAHLIRQSAGADDTSLPVAGQKPIAERVSVKVDVGNGKPQISAVFFHKMRILSLTVNMVFKAAKVMPAGLAFFRACRLCYILHCMILWEAPVTHISLLRQSCNDLFQETSLPKDRCIFRPRS